MFPLLGFGWIETSLTVYLVQFFRLGVVRLKVMVFWAMLEKCRPMFNLLKVPFRSRNSAPPNTLVLPPTQYPVPGCSFSLFGVHTSVVW